MERLKRSYCDNIWMNCGALLMICLFQSPPLSPLQYVPFMLHTSSIIWLSLYGEHIPTCLSTYFHPSPSKEQIVLFNRCHNVELAPTRLA